MKIKKTAGIGFLVFAVPVMGIAQMGQTKNIKTDSAAKNFAYQDSFRAYEVKLRDIGDSMVDGITQTRRFKAAKQYIPMLVKALKYPGSYYYPFDSLGFMKILQPEDKSFRMLNWALKCNDGTYRYYGAIQFKSDDRLKLIPLRCDTGSIDEADLDTVVTGPNLWIGAVYYKMITTIIKGKTYYILLGWDGFNYASNRKFVDVLSFDENGKPVFGAPIFNINGKIKTRVVFYYSGNSSMVLNYVEEHNIITFDHLVPPNAASTGVLYTYVPDGSYDYLELTDGKWTLKENPLKNFKTIKTDEDKK